MKYNKTGKILLVLLPFCDPQIPPLGIASIKSYLRQNGYDARAYDTNVEIEFREIYDKYFALLAEYVPQNKRGNFYSIGLDVLQNHMMAHINSGDKGKKEYIELVKILVYETFYVTLDDGRLTELDKLLSLFYHRLERYFLNLLEKERPSVLGLSVCSCTLPASLFSFKLTREKYPGILTVMGGGIFADELALDACNLEFFLEKTPYIDKIIVGEGEVLLLKLLEGKLPKSQRVYSIDDIGNEVLNIHTADTPDFSGFDLDYYPFIAYNGSRGCPYRCNFCSINVQWGKYRKKGAKKIVEELRSMYEKYGCQLFLMVDSLLNPITTDLSKEFSKTDLCLYWDGSLRAEKAVCDKENTLLWRQGGFYRAHLGIESGSPRVLQAMRKDISIKQIKAAVSSLAFAGIKTTTFWIVGFPGETEEDFQQTLDVIEELREDLYECVARPFLYYKKINDDGKSALLYPGNAKDRLIVQTWIKTGEPRREVTYQRLNRFTAHIKKLGIPNPYSWYEINQADLRWKNLHENAVPPLVEFKNKNNYLDECKKIEQLFFARNSLEDDGDFGF